MQSTHPVNDILCTYIPGATHFLSVQLHAVSNTKRARNMSNSCNREVIPCTLHMHAQQHQNTRTSRFTDDQFVKGIR